MFPIPAPVVRTMSTLDIALTMGWDLEDAVDLSIGAPLPKDLITRPADAPSRKRRPLPPPGMPS